MDYIEVTGKDVDEALMNAALTLGTQSSNLEYEVLENGSNGFLGLGKKLAKIKVRVKEEKDEDIEEVSVSAKVNAESNKENKVEAAPVVEEKKVIKEEAKPVKTEVKKDVKKEETVAAVVTEEDEEEKKAPRVKVEYSEEQVKTVVVKFLSDVFKAMNMEVNIDVKLDNEEETVDINLSGEQMGLLIGKRGQTLDSLQYLVRLIVNKEIGGFLKVKIDTEDYRNRRKETLESLAKNIAFKVKRARKSVELEPMNPYERRIIHSTLQNDKYVATKSEGEEPYRHVVVYLKKPYDEGYSKPRYNKPYKKNYNGGSRGGYNKSYKHHESDKKATENVTQSEN